MTITGLLKTGGLAALATAMAVTALPSAASAKPGDNRWSQGDRGDHSNSGGSDNRAARDSGNRGDRGDRGGRSTDSASHGDAGHSGAGPVRTVTPAPAPARVVQGGRSSQWQGGGRPGGDGKLVEGLRRDSRGGHGNDNHNWNGNNNGSHNGSWNGNNNGNHSGSWNHNNGNHGSGNHYQGNYRQWDRQWRNNNRYDWHGWRNSHRNIFHLGGYYSPYRNYSYHRLGIGFYLDSLFYSNRYWIDDPYQYRLPDAYGPYRWVRYYDDALLVDVYSGEVVDVMYDFFW